MLKKMVTSVLTCVGLLGLNAHAVLAERSVGFAAHQTLYPSTCSIAIEEKTYTCDYAVVGAFNDASANIKLCSSRYCLILMLTPTQLSRVSQGRDFYVRQMAWQRGSSIVHQWDTSMQCGFSGSRAMGCVGELEDGSAIAIYME